ncbi:hypothetical protein DDZ18_06950 [Marinicauda salina]|uniref:Excalibur calcium-binding domain-containing protein n=2 Tax=Marinicauda salina TaxID=2135793 RepID=A0A2U2BTS7_9PROT|nr:hypothetical protein DDZ18_06950 [Marinicauda salina]
MSETGRRYPPLREKAQLRTRYVHPSERRRRRRRLAAMALGGLLLGAAIGAAFIPEVRAPIIRVVSELPDRDCRDFTTQWDAQRFHDQSLWPGRHRLDDDGDGRVCEMLP